MNNKKRVILGLDISTSCLGTSVVSYDGEELKVLYVHYVKMKQSKKYKGSDNLFYKSQQFKENFINKVKEWGVTDIVIEEPLPGSQNVIVVNTLMKFNGMISQSLYEAFGIIPKYISSYDARRFAFPDLMAVRKFNKHNEEYDIKKIEKSLKNDEIVLFGSFPYDVQKKFILWNRIVELYPDIKWSYDTNNELKVENFDASDSLVCILGFINKEKYENEVPKIVEYSINKLEKEIEIKYKFKFCDKVINKKMLIIKK